MQSRESTHRTDPRRQQKVAICKTRGNGPEDIHLSTRRVKRKVLKTPAKPVQNPPQAEMLASEYIHNLQQQQYFLESEIRFLTDRAGVDRETRGDSVDASIRRLRRAIAMQEEETNAKIEQLQAKIEEEQNKRDDVEDGHAVQSLKDADQREGEEIAGIRDGFIVTASDTHLHHIQTAHYTTMKKFHSQQKTAMDGAIKDYKARRDATDAEISELSKTIEQNRAKRKEILNAFREAFRQKRMQDEKTDVLGIIGRERERPPPNTPISAIQAKNAQMELQLVAQRKTRDDIERQINDLMGNVVRLTAQLNEINFKIDRAKELKSDMEKQFSGHIDEAEQVHEKQLNEIADLKNQRKLIKQEVKEYKKKYDEMLARIDQCENETQLLNETIDVKMREKQRIDDESVDIQSEIDELEAIIKDHRQEVDQLSTKFADLSEQRKSLEIQVQANDEDPLCHLDNPPPELAPFLAALIEVNKAL